ncbi:olfactory receptor 52K1-like [Osmerus mordax]|uniref:olfactory receptor 52K1-like n=1 Tax=Osmerus mordax TaxID=8014 RepID=UPI003510BB96
MQYLKRNFSHTDFVLNGFSELAEWRPFLFLPFFIMFLISLAANSFLLFIIISQKSLHKPMFILIGLMSGLMVILPVLFVPNMLLSFLFNLRGISLVGCFVQMFCIHFISSFQSTILMWMALDRYFAICTPLHYHKYMSVLSFLKFVVAPVLRNIIMITVPISLAGKLSYCRSNVLEHCFCECMAVVQLSCGDTSVNNVVGLLALFSIPTTDFLFIITSYVIIFVTVYKSGTLNVKVLNTCLTHIIVMSVSLTFALLAFLSYRIRNNISLSGRAFFSTMYLLFPSCFNPIIYGIRTKEIKRSIIRLAVKK